MQTTTIRLKSGQKNKREATKVQVLDNNVNNAAEPVWFEAVMLGNTGDVL